MDLVSNMWFFAVKHKETWKEFICYIDTIGRCKDLLEMLQTIQSLKKNLLSLHHCRRWAVLLLSESRRLGFRDLISLSQCSRSLFRCLLIISIHPWKPYLYQSWLIFSQDFPSRQSSIANVYAKSGWTSFPTLTLPIVTSQHHLKSS
ncbi:unnamed protein product [Lactuca saligna]|uniref:Uncharacterized protein n=1 Tax=Lactuca saligna TaxID=75948 RepID=A0AA36A4P4_LACSI|nr:unnamed protein product [Lactuca saligna]